MVGMWSMSMQIPGQFQWYLFNDFAITPAEEVLLFHTRTCACIYMYVVTTIPLQLTVAHFPLEWLTPSILLFTQRGYSSKFPSTGLPSLEPSVLLAETHEPRPLQSPTCYTSLALNELPERGDLVGIDAEFVTLNQVYSTCMQAVCGMYWHYKVKWYVT